MPTRAAVSRTASRNARAGSRAPSRAERRKQGTRDRIVEAAGALFVEQGYGAATVEAICQRADIARQTFFNHFASKDALLDALVAAGRTFVRALVDRACEEGASTGERLHVLFEGFADVATHLGPNGHELIAEALRHAHTPERDSEAVRLAFERLVQKGLEDGDVTAAHRIDDLVSLVRGAFTMHVSQWAARRPSAGAPAAAIRMATLLADAIACRPATTGPMRRLQGARRAKGKGGRR